MRPSRTPLVATSVLVLAVAVLAAGCAGRGDDDGAGDGGRERATTAATAPAGTPHAGGAAAEPVTDPATRAARELPLRVLAGELVMTKLDGATATPEELEAIARLHLGGIILFGWNVRDRDQLRALVASLDAARAAPARRNHLPGGVLVSVDQEGGDIRNVPFAPPDLGQPALSSGTTAQARRTALETGRALRDAGVSMDLGPVADLASGPNRTMAGRAFGDDARRVAPYVAATVAGLEEGGVAAAAKHFPGFGASTANSDEAVAYVDRTRAQLREAELVPFRGAIEAGTSAIMVSHGIHRELGSSLPGTLDPRIATGILREELRFDGVAMTDSMNARGFREAWGDTVPRACPVALAAGIDLLLLTGSLETATSCRERILDAVEDGNLPAARVREAARRVLRLKLRFAPGAPRAGEVQERSTDARPRS